MNNKLVTVMVLFLTILLSGCVKIVKIGEEDQYTGELQFDAGMSVAAIWESAVIPSLSEKAVDLPDFLVEADGDLKSLVDVYGRYSMGTSGEINYTVKGSGIVQEVNQEKKAGYMRIALEGYDGREEIRLQIGSVYKGSSVRDSIDFIKFGDFKNQQEWAAVSQNIHETIEQSIINELDLNNLEGKQIEFVGTFTAGNDDELLITPVVLEVK